MDFEHRGRSVRTEALKRVVADNDIWHPKLWLDGSVVAFADPYPPKTFKNERDAIEYAAQYGRWLIDHPASSDTAALDKFLEDNDTIRCLICGSSRLDPEGYKCARCGGALGLRSERCYITEGTKATLLAHAQDIKAFGVTLEEHETLGKHADYVGMIGLALAVAESLNSDAGLLRKLVQYLRDIAIPEDEVLRLRLDEPEQILTYYRADKPNATLSDYGKAPLPGFVIIPCKNCSAAFESGLVFNTAEWVEKFIAKERVCDHCHSKAMYSRADILVRPGGR